MLVPRAENSMKQQIVVSDVNARGKSFWISDIITDIRNNISKNDNINSNNSTKIDTRGSDDVFDMNGTSNNVLNGNRIIDNDNNETESKINNQYYHGQHIVNGNTQDKTATKVKHFKHFKHLMDKQIQHDVASAPLGRGVWR